MKAVAVAFAFLLGGVIAVPSKKTTELETAIRSGQERLVTGNIISAIEDLAQSIVDAGLDPLHIPPQHLSYQFAIPELLNAHAYHNGVFSSGASNIVINRMNYAVLTSRLTYNIEMPEIRLDVVDSGADLNLLGKNLRARFGGSIALRNIVTTGDIRVSVGVITGISIRSIALEMRLGGIDSRLHLVLQNANVSNAINEFLGHDIPHTLRQYETEINELFTDFAREIIEANL